MILKFFKLAIEYPIPEWVTEGHPLWDAYWKCSKWAERIRCMRIIEGLKKKDKFPGIGGGLAGYNSALTNAIKAIKESK